MEKKFTNIDDVFRNSLQDFQTEPPAYVWDNINSALDKAGNKRKHRLWWLFGSGAAVVAAFVSGYYLSNVYKSTQMAQDLPSTEQVLPIDVDSHSTNESHKSSSDSNVKSESNSHLSENDSKSADEHASTKETASTTKEKSYATTHQRHKKKVVHQPLFNSNDMRDKLDDKSSTADVTMEKSDKFDNNTKSEKSMLVDQTEKDQAEPIAIDMSQQIDNQENNEAPSQANNMQFAELALQAGALVEKPQIDLYDDLQPPNTYFPLFSISPFFSPMYAIRNSSNNESLYDPIYPGSDDRFNQNTYYSYQTGVLLGYNFNRSISLHIGCTYNQITHGVNKNQLQSKPFSQAGNDSMLILQTSAGELEGIFVDPNLDNPIDGPILYLQDGIMQHPIDRIVQTFGFIEVPVLVKYRLALSRVGLLFTAGMSTGFTVRNDAYAENDFESVRFGQTRDIRNVNFNLVFGAGMDVQITPWMYFTFEPTVRYSLMNWSTREGVKINPIMIGANTGLSFRF